MGVPSRRTLAGSIALTVAWLIFGAVVSVLLYTGLAVWVEAWRYHPDVAEGASVVVFLLAVLGGLAFVYGGRIGRRDDGYNQDDDDEGGQPPPSPPPVPRSPSGTAPDWERFDSIREDWDRVPVAR